MGLNQIWSDGHFTPRRCILPTDSTRVNLPRTRGKLSHENTFHIRSHVFKNPLLSIHSDHLRSACPLSEVDTDPNVVFCISFCNDLLSVFYTIRSNINNTKFAVVGTLCRLGKNVFTKKKRREAAKSSSISQTWIQSSSKSACKSSYRIFTSLSHFNSCN